MKNIYDILVIGGGHAGVEAALAAARLGKKTALISIDLKSIARMSCNPSIGGLAKGHLVREIDVLGGEMAKATDAGGIQFKLLNRSKGRAVWSPRAQVDKFRYEIYMQQIIQNTPGLDVIAADAAELCLEGNRFSGIRLRDGSVLHGKSCILTNGTFLRGKIHIGNMQIPAGRYGELPSIGISDQLKALGFAVGRLKTGTPARITKRSIDFSVMEIQGGDPNPLPFSHATKDFNPPNIPCWLAHTNTETHDILRSALERSPLFSGKIEGSGPRYCPSIEDKIVRFSEKQSHQLFLEPEWEGSSQWYLNGFSSSMPIDIQIRAIRSVRGLERAEFTKIGYAIEYDYFPSHQIQRSLESKAIAGLYFAGQVNGTSGYEEAAAQGLIAAINAVRSLEDREPLILKRDEAYIGVLIDDLCSKETNEPYRMFTSLAEFRLLLRWDNAHLRLLEHAHDIALQSPEMLDSFETTKRETEILEKKFEKTRILPDNPLQIPLDKPLPLSLLIRRQNIDVSHMPLLQKHYFPNFGMDALNQALLLVLYRGYIDRQYKQVEKMRRLENRYIPTGIDYHVLPSLSTEGREKLIKFKPQTIGQASRIRGVSPADIQILLIYLDRPLGLRRP